jgi:hypothetical protein
MLREVLDLFELLDKPTANGNEVKELFVKYGIKDIDVKTITSEKGSTDCIKITIKGKNGKSSEGTAPTLGIIGRLGGIGARPEVIGFVSDGDGALAALAAGLKIAKMNSYGDILEGDIIVTTHICPDAPTVPHEPVPFMGGPIDMDTMNNTEVLPEMDAIISIDTTKGNRIINTRGFSISPTIKEGYILKVSDDLVNIMQKTTGKHAHVYPLSQQDITPYGNGLYHLNSILQPATATNAPVVGVAIAAEVPIAGCATGASHEIDIEQAARFAVEVAKDFGVNKCEFYSQEEFDLLLKLYGRMNHYQTSGKTK